MKMGITAIILAAALLLAATVQADVRATVSQVDGNTVVSCTPEASGEVSRATIVIYESDGRRISVTRGEMDLSSGSGATFTLPGTYLEVAGECDFFYSSGEAGPELGRYSSVDRAGFYLGSQ